MALQGEEASKRKVRWRTDLGDVTPGSAASYIDLKRCLFRMNASQLLSQGAPYSVQERDIFCKFFRDPAALEQQAHDTLNFPSEGMWR